MSAAYRSDAQQPYLSEMDPESGFIAPAVAGKKGKDLNAAYRTAQPFPHICIDGFLPPQILERCLAAFPDKPSEGGAAFDRDQERYKQQFYPDDLDPWVRSLFREFNSLSFIRILENITGIKGLIPDPYFMGAGFHEIGQGGHLSVHADFNHHKPMDLERRINVLIYLNKDWQESYGGSLELWTDGMKACAVKLTPEFNRCVIFNTTSESWHGNPDPINHPAGITRKSIALYYYTATWDDTKRDHTTQFKVRPGTADTVDWKVGLKELAKDLLPPIVARRLTRRAANDEG